MDDFAHIVGEDVHFRGRSPFGERGLKSGLFGDESAVERSLPIRGAWIEISTPRPGPGVIGRSLPIRGAWIEMSLAPSPLIPRCRSPFGERGLKCLGHAGRRQGPHQSLPIRGAWIEMS